MSRFKSLAAALFLTLLFAVSGHAEDLKLLVSVQQQSIVAPNPVRATLHFHNSGQQTLWLYRPVESNLPGNEDYSLPPAINQPGHGRAHGGSTLKVHLETVGPSGNGKPGAEGSGFAIAPDGLPHPRLVRLTPGQDYSEKVSIHVEPAGTRKGGTQQPIWGHYQFSVRYSADYSNAEALARDIKANLWRGQTSSNTVTLDLKPPTGGGSIAGTVLDSIGRPYSGALVTLSDNNENALDQLYSKDDGRFSFANLPVGQYWLTVRQPGSDRDTSVFRNVDVSQAGSSATTQIMLLPVDANKADRILHKPVLFHVVNNKGRPLPKVKLAILSSTGTIVENLKAQTGEDGFATISLIPGPIFITLRLRGCKKEDRRADVTPGAGADGFQFTYDCAQK